MQVRELYSESEVSMKERLSKCFSCGELPALNFKRVGNIKIWEYSCEYCINKASSTISKGQAIKEWNKEQLRIYIKSKYDK